jgi:hypothetical protein
LRSLGIEQYEPAFRANEIDARVVPSLTAEDLKDLGVTLVGHRRRLLDAIAALGGEMLAAAARVTGCSSANANAILRHKCVRRDPVSSFPCGALETQPSDVASRVGASFRHEAACADYCYERVGRTG